MERLPLETQTLYAELVEQLSAIEASRAIGHAAGSFITKTIRGRDYYYFQFMRPGGVKRQVYLGPRDETLDLIAERHDRERAIAAVERRSIQRLATMLRAGGAMAIDSATTRVLAALSDSGVFRFGGVLIGTHAFIAIGNLLGVRWREASLRTHDIDVAFDRDLDLALPRLEGESIPGVLERLEMGFLPVPGFDPLAPSTSFKVRGQALRLDVLTTARGNETAPVTLRGFGTAALPLKFLDYLLEEPVRAAVIGGDATLVNVPDPARFALHKLIVASCRPTVTQAKAEKDVRQAAQVLRVLADDRPGDIGPAWSAASERGRGWTKRLDEGLCTLARHEPEVAAAIREITSS